MQEKKNCPWKPPGRSTALPTPWFQPSETSVRHLTPQNCKILNLSCVFISFVSLYANIAYSSRWCTSLCKLGLLDVSIPVSIMLNWFQTGAAFKLQVKGPVTSRANGNRTLTYMGFTWRSCVFSFEVLHTMLRIRVMFFIFRPAWNINAFQELLYFDGIRKELWYDFNFL